MDPAATLGYRDGWLCAVETTTRSLEPVADSLYWPLLQDSPARWKQALGTPLYRDTSTGYRLQIGERWRTLPLAHGAQTDALAVEVQPVPRPARVRSELRWKQGKWEKKSKKKGWIAAERVKERPV